jgi:microcystin degradation protein MlrC
MAKSQESADRNGRDIAEYAWSRRKDTLVPVYGAEESVAAALASELHPVLINETSDNPGGGTPGDGTHLLRALLKANASAAYGFIFDPETAEQAKKAGVGARIACRIGGKTDKIHGTPVEIPDAYVKCVSDGVFYLKSPMRLGGRSCLGTTACLEVGNVSIIVASFRTQTFDDGPFHCAGVDWTQKKIVALKSSQHFKGWWADKVPMIIPCDSPGLQCADLTTFDFKMVDTTCFPLGDPQWSADQA